MQQQVNLLLATKLVNEDSIDDVSEQFRLTFICASVADGLDHSQSMASANASEQLCIDTQCCICCRGN